MYITYIHCISSQVSSFGFVGFSFFTVTGLLSLPDLSRGGSVLYLETQDSQLILRSAREVNTAFPNLHSPFTPVNLFIVTWLQVSPPNGTEVSWYKQDDHTINSLLQTNTFQVIIAYDGHLSFVTLLYEDIQWTDDHTVAGIFFNTFLVVDIPESNSDLRNLTTTSNVDMPGMWMYRVDSTDFFSV